MTTQDTQEVMPNVLQAIDRELTRRGYYGPMVVTNPQTEPRHELSEGQMIRVLFRDAKCFAAPTFDEQGNPINLPDDPEVVSRIRHTMRRHESMAEWFARTLIARSQVFQFSKEEIARRVKLADERAADEVPEPHAALSWAKQPQPQRHRVMVLPPLEGVQR